MAEQNPIGSHFLRADEQETETLPWAASKWIVSPQSHPDTQLTVLETILPPGLSHELHVHEHSDEVIYVLSGRGKATVGDEADRPVSPGDVLYIPAGIWHSTDNDGWEPLKMIVFYSPGLSPDPRVSTPQKPRAHTPAGELVDWKATFGLPPVQDGDPAAAQQP